MKTTAHLGSLINKIVLTGLMNKNLNHGKKDVDKLLNKKLEEGEHVSPVLPEGLKTTY
ncbi:MAG: hypothetical protein CM15mP83_8680 [Flavobacteriaceae bacterium]|nr:MAG: hypothetical protein CM15mP83_8680 [Flavobacteriaceae bacterium]